MKIKPRAEENFFRILCVTSTAFVLGILGLIIATVVWRGLPALNFAMLTQVPKGGYYLGQEGGILNAIAGSLYLAGGATLIAFVIGLPIAIYLQLRPAWQS